MSSAFQKSFCSKSPLKNGEKPLYSEADWHKVASVNDKYAVDLGTVKSSKPKKSELGGWDNEEKTFSFKLNDSDKNLINSFKEAGKMAQSGGPYTKS